MSSELCPLDPEHLALLEQNPEESASAAGLRYVCSEDEPGIRRQRRGRGFSYIHHTGKRLSGRPLERVKALVIPPAWRDVWICKDDNGHLQAVGRDSEARKQYIYHQDWEELRRKQNFARLIPFGNVKPVIRERTHADLRRKGLPRPKVLATIVRLLDLTYIRIGNPQYAHKNGSFGLTTLRRRHVEICGSKIRFEFLGKSGQEWDVELSDRRLAGILQCCYEGCGYELFKYMDDDGRYRVVEAAEVNDYLRAISGSPVSAKDFRTWGGTLLAALALREIGSASTKKESQRNVVQVVKQVAEELGNTPAVCRAHYIHPAVVSAYQEGELLTRMEESAKHAANGLEPEEHAVLDILERACGLK